MTSPKKNSESPSDAVLRAVAAHEGVDPAELEPKLYDVVDPDALDALFATASDGVARSGVRVSFEYFGYEITIRDGRELSVELDDRCCDIASEVNEADSDPDVGGLSFSEK